MYGTHSMAKFKGGTSRHSNGGYLKITAGCCRNKLVHVMIAEGMLGRKLRKDEHVHHKDGDVSNPRWTNLIVLDVTVHNAVSNRQYWYLKQKFSREDAAWKAYFDVTGKDVNRETLQMRELPDDSDPDGFTDTTFVPEVLLRQPMDVAACGD